MILEPVFLYCERIDQSLLGEPLSLAASMALLFVAVRAWHWGDRLRELRGFSVLVFLLWIGAIWLHVLPSLLAVWMNTAVILLLVVVFFYLVNRHFVGLTRAMAAGVTLLILPFLAVSLPLIGMMTGFASSSAYAPLPVLLFGYSMVLRTDHPVVARQLFLTGIVMTFGVVVRGLDLPLCDRVPVGTHFLWILTVAAVLYLICRLYRDGRSDPALAGRAGGG